MCHFNHCDDWHEDEGEDDGCVPQCWANRPEDEYVCEGDGTTRWSYTENDCFQQYDFDEYRRPCHWNNCDRVNWFEDGWQDALAQDEAEPADDGACVPQCWGQEEEYEYICEGWNYTENDCM